MKDKQEVLNFLKLFIKEESSELYYIEGFEENYCNKCVQIALKELEKEEPEKDFIYVHSGVESDVFEYCELCYKPLCVPLLINDQLINDAIFDLNNHRIDSRMAYEVSKLIDETNSEILINKVKEFINWEPETEKEINHYLRVSSGIQNNTYFADSMQNANFSKHHMFRSFSTRYFSIARSHGN